MDLLGGYASSDEEDDVQELKNEPPKEAPKPSGLLSSLPKPAAAKPAPGLLSALPKPSTASQPTVGGKRVVQLVRNIDPKLLYDSDDDERPMKKARPAAPVGSTLAALLPAPQNAYNKRSANIDLGDEEDDFAAPRASFPARGAGAGAGAASRSGAAGAAGGGAPSDSYAALGNEAYRLDDVGYDMSDPAAQYYYPSGEHQYEGPVGPAAPAAAASVPAPLLEALAVLPESDRALLEEQLARERRRGRNGGGVPEFKEISAQKIQYQAPGRAAVSDAIRTAYGNNYEAKIREEAGEDPGKKQKQKHQIGSLYHQAKMAELEMIEKKTQSMKTIKETRSKYGWR